MVDNVDFVFGVVGGLFGSVLGPWLRGRTSEETLLGGALIGLAAVSVVIAGQGVRSGAVLVAVVFAVAAAVGQQAFLSTAQRLAPHAEMGRAFAWFEARFQIAWVMGALGPVIARPSQSLGFVVLGAGLALGVAGFFTLRGTLTEGTAGGAGALVPDPTTALLALAHALVAQGDHELAVLTATEAVRVAAARTPSGTPLPHELMALWRDVAGGAPATPEIAAQALRVAEHATGINPASRTVTPTEPDRST